MSFNDELFTAVFWFLVARPWPNTLLDAVRWERRWRV